ncbi:PAS domain-containing protein [Neorhizobium sp. NPDC001467]|uniref:PAS domain-containing protein n=1 Tax=Neorhizobium sp. NPDC001467 TaxID=3390595 RepID=UPI003D01FFFA
MGDTYPGSRRPQHGYFTWDIAEDSIWGDATFAGILGLDPATADNGFSMLRYMEIVHPDDREQVVRATQIAVLTGQPYMVICRLCRGKDILTIRNRGTCFRYRDGLPSMATGMLEIIAVEHPHLSAANQQSTTLPRSRAAKDAVKQRSQVRMEFMDR